MNYLPFCGYWFYGAGAITVGQMASYYVSYGLVDTAPTMVVGVGGSMLMYPNTSMLM
jgi:hypothetical protein